MALYVRTQGDPQQIMLPVQREINSVAPQIVVTNPRTGRQIIDGGLFGPRIGVALLSVFGLLGVSAGKYWLVWHIGVLRSVREDERSDCAWHWAQPESSVLQLILKQGMSLVMTGVLIGFAAALLVGRVVTRMLYGVVQAIPSA